jgi:hypothetical protein
MATFEELTARIAELEKASQVSKQRTDPVSKSDTDDYATFGKELADMVK